MLYLSTENNYIVNYVMIIFFACRLLQDHSESTGVHSQALDTLKAKLEESERKLKASQESHKNMQVSYLRQCMVLQRVYCLTGHNNIFNMLLAVCHYGTHT